MRLPPVEDLLNGQDLKPWVRGAVGGFVESRLGGLAKHRFGGLVKGEKHSHLSLFEV